MQQNRRTGFGALLTRGWRLWSGSLGTSFPAVLLCGVLPALVIAVAGYYCLLVAFRPAFQLLQTILQSLLTYGFDEWAIGDAVSRVLEDFGLMDHEQMLRQLLGSMGTLVGVALISVPLQLASSYVLMPMAQGAVAEAQSRLWHGVRVPFGAAFAAIRRRAGRLMVLNLALLLAELGLSIVLSVVSALVALLPVMGPAAVTALELVAVLLVMGVQSLVYLVAINEDQWHFNAIGLAVKRFFTDWAYAAAMAVYGAVLVGSLLLTVLADLLLMTLALFPPVLTVLAMAFLMPLAMSFVTAVYYDQRTREGYAPACGIE